MFRCGAGRLPQVRNHCAVRALGAYNPSLKGPAMSIMILQSRQRGRDIAFFVALGAFSPGEVAVVSIGVAALAILWLVHAALAARHARGHDPAAVRARERRGF